MPYCILLLTIAVATQATMYIPSKDDALLTDWLRKVIDEVSNDIAEPVYSDFEYPDNSRLPVNFEQDKEIPLDIPLDYDALDGFNPNPSIRDQEYLQHSTMWGHQRLNNNFKNNDRHMLNIEGLKNIKNEKPDNALPAYCTPPNPCPVGYTSADHCLENFENTASFSREYQKAQDCMCDSEHMYDCPNDTSNIPKSDFEQIVEQFQEENPFFQGEKLPIAAKKGINVGF
ncbi:neuroendocrine protein 7B2 [Prorops nasuta]|uniref:neuroendocrine protein 7B2 n=1 Tax=Prorops nasuta TaxID=863751 RepID=UPI0034CD300E